ncbi:MAG TPA: hypothetical protein VK194_10890, partial [Candidatus Deferrimicrobium sp.]|nr:hypothetical protein [Candidatus Deferrimicrobium sp.]
LAAGSRRRFLAARLISLFLMTAGLFGALLLLGTILAGGLRVLGAEVTATTTPIALPAGVAWFVVQILVTMVLIALGAALTMLLRSGALTLLLVILAALIELFVSALPIFGPKEPLAGVPQAFLTTSVRTLTTRLGLDTHAVALAGAEPPRAAIDLPLLAVAAVVVAWGVLFILVADRRFRTMDIVE